MQTKQTARKNKPTKPMIFLMMAPLCVGLSACGNDRQYGEVADWWYDGTPRGTIDAWEGQSGSVVAPPLAGNDNTIFSGQRR